MINAHFSIQVSDSKQSVAIILGLLVFLLTSAAHASGDGFSANNGRLDSGVQYYGTSSAVDIFFTPNSVVLDVKDPVSLKEMRAVLDSDDNSLPLPLRRGQSLHLNFIGSNSDADIIASDENNIPKSYFFGNDSSQWATDQYSFRTLTYRNIYDGVDVVFTMNQGQLSYEIIGEASTIANNVQMQWTGADQVLSDAEGTELVTAYGSIIDNGSGIGRSVSAEDDLIFSTRGVNALLWSTMIGGSGDDEGATLAIASNGDVFVGGETDSPNFPGTPGSYEEEHSAYLDVFVSRFTNQGADLVWSSYIGTSNNDYCNAIVLDASDNPIIVGRSASSSYPTTTGAYDESYNGGTSDATVSKFSSDGSSLIFSTFVGGSEVDSFFDVVSDASGNLVCAGYTASTDYPTSVGAFQTSFQGPPYDFTVSTLSADGSTLVAGTYVGGTDRDACRGVSVDGNGDLFLSGFSFSTDFPVTVGAFQTVKSTIDDAALVKISADLTTVHWATFLGGNGSERALCIDLDSSDNPVIAGFTYSSDFPTTSGVLQETYNSSMESFVTKFDNSTGARQWSTYMGGPHVDEIVSIIIDADNNPIVTGWTTSPSFPVNSLGYDDSHNGGEDIFVSRLNPTGTSLLWGTFLGDTANDRGMEVAVDADDNPVVTGRTASTAFPTSSWAYDSSHNGGEDAIVARFDTGDANLSLSSNESTIGCGTSTDFTFSFTPDLPHTPPMRGYSVRIQAPAGLTYLSSDINVLSPLGGVNDTHQIIEHAAGDYTIDFSFLDQGAGLDVAADLFIITMSGDSEGLSSLGINSAEFRDADNHPFDVDTQETSDVNVDCTAANSPTMDAEPLFTAGAVNTVSWSDESASGATSYKAQVSDQSDFSVITSESLFIPGLTHEFTGLGTATTYYYRVISRDAFEQDSAPSAAVSSTQDATPPTSSVDALPGTVGETFDVAYTASDTGSGLQNVELFYNFAGGAFTSVGVYTASPISFTGTDGDGTYGFYTVATDNVDNSETAPGVADATTNVDTSAPNAPTLADEPLFTVGTSNTITSSDESASGAETYNFQISQLNDFSVIDSQSGNIASLSYEFTGLTDGVTYYYRVAAIDNLDHASGFSVVVSSTQDATAPVSEAGLVANQGSTTFDVPFSSVDAGVGSETVELFANFDGGVFASQGSFGSSPISFTAVSGEGTYGFYTIATDSLGNTEATPGSAQSTCILDLTPPESSVSALGAYQNSGVFNVTATGSDNLTGIESFELFSSQDAGPWTSIGSNTTGLFSFNAPADGTFGFYSLATDSVGNIETAPGAADATTIVDTNGPTGSFTINEGATATNDTNATLTMTISGATEMRFSNDNANFPDGWVAYNASSAWVLENTQGTLTVYGEFRDAAQNLLQITDLIDMDLIPTEVITFLEVSPAHEIVNLSWHNPDDPDLDHIEVWRGLLHDGSGTSVYPEYSGSVIPAAPIDRATALASTEWELAGTTVGTTEAFADTFATRGVYYYEVFAVDAAGNFSMPSAQLPASTNYILGDMAVTFDGLVDVTDLTVLGSSYGLNDGDVGFNNHADVGPTNNSSGAGIPQPDNFIGFEDLMITSSNYGLGNKNQGPAKENKANGPVILGWAQSSENGYTLRLLSSNNGLKGLNLSAALPEGVSVHVQIGALMHQQSDTVFVKNIPSHGLDAGCSLMGVGQSIVGEGDLLTVNLVDGTDLTPLALENLTVLLRDTDNQELEYTFNMASGVELPVAYVLGQNYPNPFNPMTAISFSLPQDERVRLEIYGVDGRRVATLVDESMIAGNHQVNWMGRDDSGHQVASGVYFYRITAGEFNDVQKMTLMK